MNFRNVAVNTRHGLTMKQSLELDHRAWTLSHEESVSNSLPRT